MTAGGGRPFEVTVTEQSDTVVVRVAGEVDVVTAPVLRRHLDSALAANRDIVVIDLSDTTFLDARGVAVLVHARKHVVGSGGHLVVRRPPPLVRRVLELAQELDRVELDEG